MSHDSVKESGGLQGSGGVSVYYSHMLQLLFFSYTNGRSFAASINTSFDSFYQLFPIDYKVGSSFSCIELCIGVG